LAASAAARSKHTYGQILKSSALMGGSSVFNVGVGIVRTKIMALLLGPAGFGLIGLYSSIVNLTQSIACMGIDSSGVRQIAAAVGSLDMKAVGRTAAVLRRSSVVLGALGAVLLLVFSAPISKLTFNSYDRTYPVALLSLAVLFRVVSEGQRALIRGLRRISDLVRSRVTGEVLGAVASVVFVLLFREQGIVPALIAIEAAALLLSWWFSRKARLETPSLSASEAREEAGALLKLGFAFMVSGMLMTGAAYAVRMMVVREIGYGAAGLYQSAWTIGGFYVGFILQAMGADFYPRLTAVIENHEESNRLVNEQALVSLLLAGPGVLATLTFAPLVIPLFYSAAFQPAAELLRWLCLGVTLRVITWPMGFIVNAKARQNVFIAVEAAYTVVYLALAWLGVKYLGLNGAGAAFFGSYVFHGLLIYPVVRWLTGFRWSAANKQLAALFLAPIALVFCGFYLLPPWLEATVGTLAVVGSGVYTLRTLGRLVSLEQLPGSIRRLVVRIWPSASHRR
jgi:PST family polysaccharide transporter